MSEEIELTTLKEVTYELGLAYKSWKTGETRKNKYKDQFFKLVNQHFGSETLAEQIIVVRAATEDEARDLVAKSHPKWVIDDLREAPNSEELWEVIIIENPEFKTHSFVNPDDGQVYTRQVQSGSIMLDDERLQERDPDLWLEITRIPNEDAIYELLETLDPNWDPTPDVVNEHWKGPREVLPFDDLSPDTLARLGEYIYEGKPTVKLAAPRKAKEEDLCQ